MKTGLIWVSYAKDVLWFALSAASYRKFARGWDMAKCIVPKQDEEQFKPLCANNGIELEALEEWTDKPFNWHQFIKSTADQHLPNADVIYHIDSDAVFAQPCTPKDWMVDTRILMPYTPYDAFLKRPEDEDEMLTFMGYTGKKVDFDRGQYNWRFAVEYALGHRVERECMAWNPIVHWRQTYTKMRDVMNTRWPGRGFDGYVRSCRDQHPQTFCEFNTLGAIAHKYFDSSYFWYDLHFNGKYPFLGKVIQSWSHGGLDRPHDYGEQVQDKSINTPRKLFESIGLL
jgi:hypothetical protein